MIWTLTNSGLLFLKCKINLLYDLENANEKKLQESFMLNKQMVISRKIPIIVITLHETNTRESNTTEDNHFTHILDTACP